MANSKDIFKLNITDISGNNSREILNTYINELESYIKTHSLDNASLQIYNAYLNGLKYYRTISNPNGIFFETILDLVSKQYTLLEKKYPGLKLEGRIKSILSANEKIKDKICEYIKTGRDLSKLNFSLRDFVAFRFILPPAKFESLAIQNCYRLLGDHIKISRKQGFVPVQISKEKMEQIKSPTNYSLNPEDLGIHIPKFRSPFFKREFDNFVKDYIRYPKKTLYQSLHYCVNAPKIKGNEFDSAIEFQFRTSRMHQNSEHGIFSHDEIYKPNEFFHILNVPTFIKSTANKKIQVYNFEKNIQIKYDAFGRIFDIPYKHFKKLSKEDQVKILKGTHIPVFNSSSYSWEVKELNYLPALEFKRYQINHTDIQKSFNKILKHNQVSPMEKE